jgi:cyanophycinase-like exopeptidase
MLVTSTLSLTLTHYTSMLRSLLFSFAIAASMLASAQSYTSYFTGDTTNVNTTVTAGLCLMGGATENDSAMTWWLQCAGGGDIVVIRASGSDGYNDYLYTDLGLTVNSVETIVFNDATASAEPYVRRRIAEAEAIWIAGGDQWNYVNYWKGTGIDSIVNSLANIKGIPVGGTSAGMAVLGWNYFSAQNGTATSADALANPFNTDVTVGHNDFLKMPWMRHVITDTHYDNPDRRPRHFVFMSRLMAASGDTVRGIACDEYTAVCIDGAGLARVYGDYPAGQDYAYFLQVNCATPNNPEVLQSGQPITWNRGGAAVKACWMFGTPSGTNTFSLADWKTTTGNANWENWYAQNGGFTMTPNALPPNCLTNVEALASEAASVVVYPNPATGVLCIESPVAGTASLLSADGRMMMQQDLPKGKSEIAVDGMAAGVYYLKAGKQTIKVVVQ